MSALGFIEATSSSQDGAESWTLQLTALRHACAEHFDPVCFRHIERLLARAEAATGALRRVLDDKLHAAVANYAQRFRCAQQTARDAVTKLSAARPDLARELRRLFKAGDYQGLRRLTAQAVAPPGCAPLVQLNRYIQDAVHGGIEGGLHEGPQDRPVGHNGTARPEMKSVRRFRETWSRIAADDQVHSAMQRGPENAGPLNSHLLVLRSLAWMRELSPDYLRRFLSQVDTLLWLEQAGEPAARSKAKVVRREKQKR